MKNFTDTLMAGYQGWFATPGNQILKRWSHWDKAGTPRPGYTAFELYPDLSEYKKKDLCKTGYADLNGGGQSLLFDSDSDGVVKLHFKWM
ncbi:MAG: xylosidase, partial [bacterium]|nr:xylosidase [bacterium]